MKGYKINLFRKIGPACRGFTAGYLDGEPVERNEGNGEIVPVSEGGTFYTRPGWERRVEGGRWSRPRRVR